MIAPAVRRLAAAFAVLATALVHAHEQAQVHEQAAVLDLSAEQRALLAAHPVLRLGVESNWPPIEFVDEQGQYSGVVSSYMRSLEQQLGIRLEVVRKDSFDEVLKAFERGEIDVLSALIETEQRRSTMAFSRPYINFTIGLIVRIDEPYVERLAEVAPGRRLAVVQGYGSNELAASNHPQLVAVPVRTTHEALIAVATNRADIAVAPLAAAYQIIQHEGFGNLRVAANFDEFEQTMAMAVRPQLSALVPAFDAALAAITPAERDAMREQWTKVPIDRGVSRQAVLRGTVLALATLAVLSGWLAWLLAQQRRNRLLQRADAAETQLRAVFAAVPATFWRLKVETSRPAVFTYFSGPDQPENLLFDGNVQYSFEEGTRRLLPEDRQRFQYLLERHGPALTPFRFEYRVSGITGAEGWALMQAVPKRERGVLVWYGCALDISERKQLEAALEQSRNQLEELAAGVPGALWQFRKEPDGFQHYSYMSEGIVHITGRTAEQTNQLMKDKSFVSVYPDDLPILQNLMQRLTEKPGIEEARYRLRTLDDGFRWVQVAARAMPVGADGAIVWNGITLDATRIQQTEEALRQERERLEDLADSFVGALWRMSRSDEGVLRFDYVSKGIESLTGNTPEVILSGQINPLQRIAAADRGRVIAALDHSAESLTPLEVEFAYQRHDGSEFRLALRAGVRRIDGRPVWTGVGFDTTERHRLALALDEAHARIEDITSSFPGAIFQMMRTPEGAVRFTYMSENIRSITGRPAGMVLNKPELPFLVMHPDDRERVRAVIDEAGQALASAHVEYRLRTEAGDYRWVTASFTARPQPDGAVVWNGVLLDASEQKRLEAELRAAGEAAEAGSRAKTRFLAHMSHEIRTPMNAVIGLAHLAMTSATDPLQAERIGKVHSAGRALLKLLNDILEYSRLDARKVTPKIAPFDLHELKAALRLFCAPAAETKGLGFVIDCETDMPMHWLGDATRIQQVLLNLITNAIKFTDSGSVTLVICGLAPGQSGLCLEVHDTGIGMSAAELTRVFDAFEQASGDTERRHGGSGLGLSICKALVETLGGRLSVESAQGQGTRFRVELPLQAAQMPRPLTPAQRNEVLQALARLAEHVRHRDIAAARNTLQALRLALMPQDQGQEIHALERMLADFDFDAARIEMTRLRSRWSGPG